MSVITNVLLTFSGIEASIEQDEGDDHYPIMDPINEWLAEEQAGRTFTEVGDSIIGLKRFTRPLFGYCGNYLNWRELVTFIRQQPWEYPEHLRIWIEDEHDDFGFTEYRHEEPPLPDCDQPSHPPASVEAIRSLARDCRASRSERGKAYAVEHLLNALLGPEVAE